MRIKPAVISCTFPFGIHIITETHAPGGLLNYPFVESDLLLHDDI